jgi:agmatinase
LRLWTNPELRRIARSSGAYLHGEPERVLELTADTFALLDALREPRALADVLPEISDEQAAVVQQLLELRVLLREGEAPRRAPVRWRPGLMRFLNAPRWSAAATQPDDWVVVGARSDANTMPGYPRGSAAGPDAIRAASKPLSSVTDLATGQMRGFYDPDGERTVLAGARFADAGDVEATLTTATWDELATELRRSVAAVRAAGGRVLLLGGDHSVALPAIEALGDAPLGILHFDAHSDLAPIYAPGDINHGNVMRHVARLPQVQQIVQLGCRGFQLEAPSIDGVAYRSWSVARLRGGAADEARAWMRDDLAWYLSIDIDVLDPSIAPGTPAPVPDGLLVSEARGLIRALAGGRRIVGIDVVEVSPEDDAGGLTAHSALQLVIEALAAAAPPP